ncbi:MAG: zf-HC2 domain-containing protein [Acidimicrobiales bacterium]
MTDDLAPAGPGSGHLGDLLSALLDGELPTADVAAARTHLAGCRECAAEHAAVALARAWVRALPPVEPPATFYARIAAGPAALESFAGLPAPAAPLVAARLPSEPVRRRAGSAVVDLHRRRRLGVAALAGCAAAALGVVGLSSPPDPATSPPVGRFIEAHATAVGGGDPVSHLAPVAVPVSFRR